MQETQETWVWSLGRKEPLEKEMTIHSSILAWRIPWREKPGGLQRVRYDWVTEHARGKAQWVSGYVMFFKRYIKIISLFGLWYSLQLYHLVFNGISPPLFMWQTLAGHLLYSRHRRTKTLSLGARVWVERRQRSSGAERGSLWLSQNGQGILTEKVTWSRDREEQREGAT